MLDVFWVAYASINNVEAVTQAQSNKTLNIKKAEWSETANDTNTDELTIDNIRYKRYNGVWKIWNTRLYTGREYDAELKLYYNRARYYSPDLGRFISRDPIDIADDVNLYAYVGNNGVMFVDLFGREKNIIWELRLYVNSGDLDTLTDWHAWLEFVKNDWETVSYWIWRDWWYTNNTVDYRLWESNILKNYELENDVSLSPWIIYASINLTFNNFSNLNEIINNKVSDNYKWGYLSPSTDFATDIWEELWFDQLEDRNTIWISNPDTLYYSILNYNY